jgi:hypothetical protein
MDRPDVRPVAAIEVRVHVVRRERRGDHLAAEVDGAGRAQDVDEHVAVEDVDAHRRDERRIGRRPRDLRALGYARPDLQQPIALRLLLERLDPSGLVEAEDPHRRGILDADRLRRDRDLRLRLVVVIDQIAEVHAIQMIAGEDEEVLRLVDQEMPQSLPHGIRGALEPVRVLGRLLGREDLDEPAGEGVEAIRLVDVAIERGGVELREHEHAPQVRVQAVADRNVDEPVLAADRHGRLRSRMRQREEAGALAAAKDDREGVGHVVYSNAHTRAAKSTTEGGPSLF